MSITNCNFRLKKQCKTCPFSNNKEALVLDIEKHREIIEYLLEGRNHLCHSDRTNNTVCYGGRKLQLQMFYLKGYLKEPTHVELVRVQRSIGIEPGLSLLDGLQQELENE